MYRTLYLKADERCYQVPEAQCTKIPFEKCHEVRKELVKDAIILIAWWFLYST